MDLIKNLSKEQAINLAAYFVKLYLYTLEDPIKNYPCDLFMAIAEDWDLNLWQEVEESGKITLRATVYKVIHLGTYDETDTSEYYPVPIDFTDLKSEDTWLITGS